ncbi:flavin reductase family protein [Planctomycetes bacterium K23_9]|uniref:Flavin reductase like domain protein n=1 Tax=Stieleria marina TaxID=1930275 RepID=A0A517NX67_9BACT|nr:Flavin reductase like domain protein [Planctomycetes bacterium K23_9]
MKIDPEELSTRELYQWMTQLITPRPIAWVSTVSPDGIANLAPFSFFNGVGANPPTIMFCPANQRDGTPKDTLANIQRTGQFAVNLVSFADADAMNATSAPYRFGQDEFEIESIAKADCDQIKVPRVADAIASMECSLHTAMQIGTGPGGANLVIGRVLQIHVRQDLILPSQELDASRLDTIGRMGRDDYIRTGSEEDVENASLFDLPRPKKRSL